MPVLLFDLDGTLVDSARGIAAALNRLRGQRGGEPLPVEAVRPLVALGAEVLVRQGLGPLASKVRDDLAAFRRHLAAEPADHAAIYPGVPAALDRLAGEGWRMAIVTNKPEAIARALLGDLGLSRHFGVVVGGDTTAPKPSPTPLRHALRLLGADAGSTLFVGDSRIDAEAARACAMPFLLFDGGYGAADCAARDIAGRFDRFADLPDLVALNSSPCRAAVRYAPARRARG